MLSPTPHYHEIIGRAAEIARALGSPVGGAEHLFLAMVHDGGWPVSAISSLVDLARAEAAVRGILDAPGYSPPPPPRFFVPEGYVQPSWGAEVAAEMGDSYLGVEHALLAMIRNRETVPAQALAGLADLDTLDAAVTEAKDAPAGEPHEDAVFLPEGQNLDSPLSMAIIDALPEGTTFGFNGKDGRMWIHVFGSGGSLGPEVSPPSADPIRSPRPTSLGFYPTAPPSGSSCASSFAMGGGELPAVHPMVDLRS
jgi:hypothetical protein